MSLFLQALLCWIILIPPPVPPLDSNASRPTLGEVRDYCYLLQPGDTAASQIAENDFDLIILDYARHGDQESEFTPDEISTIKSGGSVGQPKILLAYLSIGEAEDYRFYWKNRWDKNQPSWLGPENPDWSGNYKVRFWEQAWKDILFGTSSGAAQSYLDRIIEQGFDGVYLDIIDAYEFWSSQPGGNELSRRQARLEMLYLLQELKEYARAQSGKPEFLLLPQNAADIIYDDQEVLDQAGIDYLAVCDGLGQEDTWFDGTYPQPAAESAWLLQTLDLFQQRGKSVLAVDYIWEGSADDTVDNILRFNEFYTRASARGFIPYAADSDRALDQILLVFQGNGILYDQPHREKKAKKIHPRRVP